MSLVTPSQLKIAYSEFTSVDDAVVQFWLDSAEEEINLTAWGTRASKAEMALACHMMIVSGVTSTGGAGGGSSGAIASVSVGDVSVSYDSAAAAAVSSQGLDPSLASSRYGVEYARLVKTMAYGAAVI